MVQTYLAQREKEGMLAVRDPDRGRRFLRFLAVESNPAKPRRALWDAVHGRPLGPEGPAASWWTSDTHWRVVDARVLPAVPASPPLPAGKGHGGPNRSKNPKNRGRGSADVLGWASGGACLPLPQYSRTSLSRIHWCQITKLTN